MSLNEYVCSLAVLHVDSHRASLHTDFTNVAAMVQSIDAATKIMKRHTARNKKAAVTTLEVEQTTRRNLMTRTSFGRRRV